MDPNVTDVRVWVAGDVDGPKVASLRARWSSVDLDERFEQRITSWLRDDGERRTTWLAAVGVLPVGMVSLWEYRRMPKPGRKDSRWGYVGNLFVRDDHRRRGIGAALVARLAATADEREYVRLLVSPSIEAVGLFRRGGFVAPDSAGVAESLLVRPGGSS